MTSSYTWWGKLAMPEMVAATAGDGDGIGAHACDDKKKKKLLPRCSFHIFIYNSLICPASLLIHILFKVNSI
jgi:hypothetical protein